LDVRELFEPDVERPELRSLCEERLDPDPSDDLPCLLDDADFLMVAPSLLPGVVIMAAIDRPNL